MWTLKVLGAVVLGLVGGFLVGLVLSEVVAISARMVFGGAPWLGVLRFVPGALAVVGAVGAPVLVLRARRS